MPHPEVNDVMSHISALSFTGCMQSSLSVTNELESTSPNIKHGIYLGEISADMLTRVNKVTQVCAMRLIMFLLGASWCQKNQTTIWIILPATFPGENPVFMLLCYSCLLTERKYLILDHYYYQPIWIYYFWAPFYI